MIWFKKRNRFLSKCTAVLFLLVSLIGACTKPETYNYVSSDGIALEFKIERLVKKEKLQAVFLYFDLTINKSDSNLSYFNPGKISGQLNGATSTATYYSSLASQMPEKMELKEGETKYSLYLVFPDSVGSEFSEFRVLQYGLL